MAVAKKVEKKILIRGNEIDISVVIGKTELMFN